MNADAAGLDREKLRSGNINATFRERFVNNHDSFNNNLDLIAKM